MKFLLSFLIALFLLACTDDFSPKVSSSKVALGTMTDPRDGQTYKTVKIGKQTWMAENLNYKTDSSFCYNDDSSNCAKYGRLYKLSTALDKPESECSGMGGKACTLPPGDVQGVCPSGWHLPSRAEWDTLIAAAGGEAVAGKFLKSSSGWEKDMVPIFQPLGPSPMEALKRRANSGDGEDTFLFSAMAAGCREKGYRKKGYYRGVGYQTNFWTSTKRQCSFERVSFHYEYPHVAAGGGYYGSGCYANSVRCLKDEFVRKSEKPVEPIKVTVGSMKDSRDGHKYKTVKIGEQVWMAQNLNYEMDYSYCSGDDTANCAKYGRLYNWNAAKSACPEGWHLPSKAEWGTLFFTVGGDSIAGKVLKSSSGWENCGDGTDVVSFSALPANDHADFWSSTEVDSSVVNSVAFLSWKDSAKWEEHNKGSKFSVRCLKGGERREGNAATPIPSSVVPHSVAESDSGRKDSGSKAGMTNFSSKTRLTDFITDSRDGHKYKTVKIGEQIWMAENLNYKTDSSFCYKDSASFCAKYGHLYTWAAATSACPEGWHLPSEDEWKTLFRVVDKRTSIGTSLKSASGWRGRDYNGLDSFGFSALPAGKRRIEHISGRESNGRRFTDRRIRYEEEGGVANFWGSTEAKDSENREAYIVCLGPKHESSGFFGDKEYAYSVRCLRD